MFRVLSKIAVPFAAVLMLGACVVQAPPRTVAVPSPAMPRMFVYPAQGQSDEQLQRDRYECHGWAVQQSGYDPSKPGQGYSTVVMAPLPGTGTATGALGGAILGSILAGPRDSGFGFLFGAATGAIVGSAVDANNQAQVAQAQHQAYQQAASEHAQVQAYRRAVTTCLEARGYSVG